MLLMSIVQANLTTRRLGREITYYPFTDSTNDDLWALVKERTAKAGQVVVTDDQRSGKGRRGRRWLSAPGKGLLFSVRLHPGLSFDRLGLVSLAAGVAVVDALASEGMKARLKWPNDIMVDQLKLGGILAESRLVGEHPTVVLGIGLNVNELAVDFPEELRSTATSMRIVLNRPLQREPVLAHILNRMEQLLHEQLGEVVPLWLDRCAHVGQLIRFHGTDGVVEGWFMGVDESGQGILERGDRTMLVSAGDLDWVPD